MVMIMMVLLAALHINITNGNLNAYILYSQTGDTAISRTWIHSLGANV